MSRTPGVYAETCPTCGQHVLIDRDTCAITEAARALGVSVATLRIWADSGKLPSHRTLGGHRRFVRDDVARFAASLGAGGER